MPLEVEDLSLRSLESLPAYDSQRFVFDVWRKNQGTDCSSLLEMADQLVILSSPETHEMPQILSLGKDTLAAKVIGADWHDDAAKRGEAESIAASYKTVVESSEPVFEWARYKVLSDGCDTKLTYSRALFPFKTARGFPYIVTVARCLKFSRLVEPQTLSNLQTYPSRSLETNNLPLLGKGGTPIATRLVSDL